MRILWNRAAAAAVNPCAAPLLAAGLLLAGCENATDRADRAAHAAAAKVYDADARGTDPQKAISPLAAVANTAGISNTTKVGAKLRLADAETAAADTLARKAADHEREAARLAGDARGLIAQVRANNAVVALYRGAEPKAARDQVAAQTDAAAKGAAGGAWVTGEGGSLPAKAAIAEQVKALTAEVADLQAKRAALDAEATQSTRQADDLTAQAEKVKGQKGLDLNIQAAGLRKKARDAAAQIDTLDVSLSRAQQDLKIAQARGPAVDDTIKALAAKSAQFDATWEGAQARMKEMTALSEKLLGKPGTGAPATPPADAAAPTADAPEGAAPAPTSQPLSKEQFDAYRDANTINATLDRIAALVADAAKARQEAMTLYDSARQHTQDAQTAAKAASDQVSGWVSHGGADSTQKAAWNSLKDSLSPGQFTLRLAVLDGKVAAARGVAATGLALRGELRSELEPVLQAAALPAPAAFQAPGFGDAEAAKEEAKAVVQSYQAAEQQFGDVVAATTGGSAGTTLAETVARNAKVAQANTFYAHAQFASLTGDADAAKTLRGNAVGLFADESGSLPAALAPEIALAVRPASAATQPAAGATTEPTAPGAPGQGPEAAIRQVASRYIDALVSGDAGTATSLLEDAPGAADDVAVYVRLFAEAEKFRAAVAGKFPGDGERAVTLPWPALAQLTRISSVRLNGDTALLVKGFMGPMTLKQVGGQWKIQRETDSAEQIARVRKLIDTLEQGTSDVAAGKYATLQDMDKAIGNPIKQVANLVILDPADIPAAGSSAPSSTTPPG